LGIFVQTFAQTFATLTAFSVGLIWHLQATNSIPAGANPFLFLFSHNWTGVEAKTAETMAFITLSLCELFRVFTCRSERLSVFQIGVFSNPWLVGAVALSVSLLLPTVFVPFLNPIFDTHWLTLTEWEIVVGLVLIPAVTEEITKWFLRRRG
jgi:P-type Ca2+ transporter type 2C